MIVCEEKKSSTEVYSGKIIKVFKDEVSIGNEKSALREVVRHKGACAVLAVDENNYAYFVEQFRYPVGMTLFEVPAGKIDPNEKPLECAKRELLEECGIRAEKWTELGPMLTSPGFCDEAIYLFIAQELSEFSPNPDEDEFLDIKKLPLKAVLDEIREGKIPDAKTQTLVLRGCDILNIK